MISKTVKSVKLPSINDEEVEQIPKDVLLIAQQIKIARSLASNDLRERTKQLKKLKKWLNIRANSSFPFSEDDFLRIWKGLYYCMWMSDKPLVQEELAEDLGSLLHCFSSPEISVQFFGAFLKAMALEWFGIDQWRIDKFLMLVRRMFRHMFQVLKEAKWKKQFVIAFNKKLKASILNECESKGLILHIMDVYLDELAKVADGDISAGTVTLMVKPFVRFLCRQDDFKLLSHTRRNIFYQLLWQSNMGREFSDKFNAWKMMGFPTENINDLEKVEDMDVEEEEESSESEADEDAKVENKDSRDKPLDPRAGCVDVVVPELPFDAEPIIKEFEKIQFDDITNTKSRKFIRDIIEKLKTYQAGEFPLGIKKMPQTKGTSIKSIIDKKAEEIEKFEDELLATTRTLKKLNKKKRKRILESIDVNSDEITADNYEQILAEAIPAKKPKLSSNAKSSNSWAEEDVDESFLNIKTHSLDKLKEKLNKKQKKIKATLIKENVVNNKKNKLKKKKKQGAIVSDAATTDNVVNGFTETAFDVTDLSQTGNIQSASPNKNQKKKKKVKPALDESDISTAGALEISPKTQKKPETEVTKQAKDKSTSKAKTSEWEVPLQEGETEYFVPSRKIQVQKANQSLQGDIENTSSQSNLVLNPFAKNKAEKKAAKNQLLGKGLKKAQSLKNIQSTNTPDTISGKKRVKIVLQKNSAQKPSEYIKQVLNSPQVPFDAEKKPKKSLLKPNLLPSPINPFYKKKIGLKLNDTC